MPVSYRAFLIDLYEEYLEEASFLYAQRPTLFQNPEITWRKIGEFEERLEAHIDGLVVGDKLALDVCQKHAAEGDFGELYAATCVFCRQDRQDLVLAAFDALDPEDGQRASAITDALKHELPGAWVRDMLLLLNSGDVKLASILAQALGYRRAQCGEELVTALKRCSTSALPQVIWALGRIRYEPANDKLFEYLTSEEDPVRHAASIALSRLGDLRAHDYCVENASSNEWLIPCLGLAGGSRATKLLTNLAEKGRQDCLLALGLHGDPASLPFFLSRLEKPESAATAASALQCLTGADLSETAFIPDEVDEDELFESERANFKPGDPLMRGDGKPFGSNVTRLSQNASDWNRWVQANGKDFIPGVRYRWGKPFSPHSLASTLLEAKTPFLLRQNCSEEFAIQYGYDFGFEADLPVRHQVALLSKALDWSNSIGAGFREGAWYFGGKTAY